MSIATVVTRGYGSFGSVNKLPTWGYSIGAAAAASYSGGWIAETRHKVLIAETRSRVWIAGKK